MEMLRRKRKQTVVLDEIGLIVNPLEDFMFYGGGKGGGDGGVQYIPMQQEPTQYTPPPAPPPKEEEATMELAEETDEDIARYSILHDNDRLFMSKYLTYLPSKEQLKAEIDRQKEIFYMQHPTLSKKDD